MSPVADLDAFSRAAPEAGIFCDFDGCLAPIVPEPDDARPPPGAPETLERLAARFRVVAVVSGRSASDLAGRVRARGVALIGLHGMEEVRDGRVSVLAEAEMFRDAVERAASRLERELASVPGAVLERKGLALAVHFRRADDPADAERRAAPFVRAAAAEDGLEVVPGRRILEVRPAAGGDKGDAIRRVIDREGLRAGLVGGDDTGDLPAFAALDGLAVAIRVAVASAESPLELTERADVVVASPAEFVELLDGLAGL